MQRVIETKRLLLRPLTAADLDDLVALDSDPAVMRYLSGGPATPRAVVAAEIIPRSLGFARDFPGFGVWAATERATGRFVGWFSFHPDDPAQPDEAALGYRLRREAWGRGYATEGSRALLALGFGALGVTRATATTYEENAGSRRVLEKLGFRLVRRFRPSLDELQQGATYAVAETDLFPGDDVEYALSREEWSRG